LKVGKDDYACGLVLRKGGGVDGSFYERIGYFNFSVSRSSYPEDADIEMDLLRQFMDSKETITII